MKLHHVGWAVLSIDKSLETFRSTLQRPLRESPVYFDSHFNVYIQFIYLGDEMPSIELIAPGAPVSLLNRILSKRGPGPYHVCYEVPNLTVAATHLQSLGYRPLAHPHPAPALDGALVQFYTHQDLGLVELLEVKP